MAHCAHGSRSLKGAENERLERLLEGTAEELDRLLNTKKSAVSTIEVNGRGNYADEI